MTHDPEDLPSTGLPQPKRVEITAAWLADTVEKQRLYRDRRRLSTAAWHGPAPSPNRGQVVARPGRCMTRGSRVYFDAARPARTSERVAQAARLAWASDRVAQPKRSTDGRSFPLLAADVGAATHLARRMTLAAANVELGLVLGQPATVAAEPERHNRVLSHRHLSRAASAARDVLPQPGARCARRGRACSQTGDCSRPAAGRGGAQSARCGQPVSAGVSTPLRRHHQHSGSALSFATRNARQAAS